MIKLDLITIILLYIYLSSLVHTVWSENSENVGYNPIETQRAECTLISGDVRASAEASVSRKLEGFCATDHLSRAFGNLEYRLLSEINHLRALINLLLPPLYQQQYFAQPQPQLYQPLPSIHPQSNLSNVVKSTQVAVQPEKTTDDPETSSQLDQIQNESPFAVLSNVDNSTDAPIKKSTTINETTEPTNFTNEKHLEFKPVQKKTNERKKPYQKIKTGPREFEINKLNNTIQTGDDLHIFTYYWKIEEFSVKLKSNVTTISSPIFSISGLFLRVTATMNYLGDFLHLQLEQVSVEKGTDKSNIILKTGDIFTKIETKVTFKHKIAILNQVTPTSDLISNEFANTNDGFRVPNSAILSGPYSKDDNLLIKIIINL
ncbi:uncharacterized protein LOC116352001 [Contarinia nasturtii]|uniref:uncharacterized protein LOC116352001 n=1 Tax=Contarinia nasturtii TaxID=265458 RepID=UPI0012D41985|nr:uncharacterized protein LOC116352001 [Contarinia nasturtii]